MTTKCDEAMDEVFRDADWMALGPDEIWYLAWEAATLAERERCASVSGPKCAEAILAAAGMACCDNA